jgi:hypothetical protein
MEGSAQVGNPLTADDILSARVSLVMTRLLLLASAAWLSQPALVQPATPSEEREAPATEPPLAADEEEADQEIVVRGLRERGAVIGDIPPENQLDVRDIRATGAASVTELLQNIASQTGSARGRGGGPPVVLLNGRRTSGFQELRDLPPEAIFRVDILPEEVALKYGYRADQRVVNIVLRPRFRSTAARVEAGTSTEGGRGQGELDVTRLLLRENGRISLNAHAERSGRLLETQRDIALQPVSIGGLSVDPRPYRTLVPERTQLRIGGTVNRSILDDVSATLDARLERVTGASLFGPDATGLAALNRDTTTESGRLGFALNGDVSRWRWSTDGAYEVVRAVTESERFSAPLDVLDRGRSLNRLGNVALVLNGPLVELPAGRSNLTLRLSGDTRDLGSRKVRGVEVNERDLSRDRVGAAVNADFPLTRRDGPLSDIGNLTLNANAEVERLSDFGTLWTYGGGFSWSPAERLNLLASWTREEGAPGLEQLGDPLLDTPGSRIFDFVTGTTAIATIRTGGNPDLRADTRTVWKLGGTWRPLANKDLDLRADYTVSRLRDPVSFFPGPTAAIQDAFEDRFIRDPDTGALLFADLRPVNFERADRETLRYGFNWSKRLTSRRPTPEQIERFRRSAGLPERPAGGGSGPGAGSPPPGARPPGGFGGGRGGLGGFGGGRPFGARGQGGRLSLSLYHNVNLRDEVLIRPGVPVIDYLSGEAVDGGGGRPRHTLEFDGGWFNNGLGVRLSGSWRSATEVRGGPAETLRFSPFARADLRLFANLGEQFGLVGRYPRLRGTQVRLEVDNILNNRPRVRDAGGGTPLNYQPDLLDPTGRTVGITLRKLFLPARFQQRRGRPE